MAQLVFEKYRPTIAIGVDGQSNERNNVLASETSEKTNYPLAFGSLRVPSRKGPQRPALTKNGGWWWYVHDELWDMGYNPIIVNGAIGSLSFQAHSPAITKSWAANTAYYQRRDPIGGDFGDTGDIISVNSAAQFFVCTVGSIRSAFTEGGRTGADGVQGNLDYIANGPALLSGGSAPNWAGVSIGSTITDGALTWLRVSNAYYNGRIGSAFSSKVDQQMGNGFDPLGVMHRLHREMQRIDADKKIIYIQNAQSDLSAGAVNYANILQAKAEFYLDRDYDVAIGLSCWGGNASNSSIANYDALATGRANALATLKAAYPGRVFDGANLYGSMGTTGPMAARTFRATISGNTLTDDGTLSWGGPMEIGMRVGISTGVLYGTIASFGTGTGGAGTYTLDRTGAGVDTSNVAVQTDMRGTGAFLQFRDAVHLSGAGAVGPDVAGKSCAGKHVSDAFKAVSWLPDRRPLIVDQYGNAVS